MAWNSEPMTGSRLEILKSGIFEAGGDRRQTAREGHTKRGRSTKMDFERSRRRFLL